jgi:two-component system, NarL family, invasion response regulator UvrY
MTAGTKIKLAVVDDHKLFRRGLINLIQSFGHPYELVFDGNNGQELVDALQQGVRPDLVIIDINMPVMNGFETSRILQKEFPDIKILVITMVENEQTLIRMLRCGIRGYLSKDVEPAELLDALNTISSKGYFYTDLLTGRLIHAIHSAFDEDAQKTKLNDREMTFLKLACSEYTYKEIADIMCLSVKTIDGYRNALFEKLHAKSRVGLVLYAIKHQLVDV